MKNNTTGVSYISEAGMVNAIGDHVANFNVLAVLPVIFPMETINIRIYKDAEETLANYKTFDFDYTDKTNPLLEKELFHQLKKVLQAHGLAREENNPQITISMDFFIGKKEQYTPPTTVTSTELKSVWNYGMIGWNVGGYASAVPVTSSTTMPGYTTTTYYSNIRLNFLNHAKLAKGEQLETPPLIWLGEADSEGSEPDIRGIAPVLFNELIGEFPEQSTKGQKRDICRCRYGGLGLGFDAADWRIVRYVEPGSVAAVHGIKPGDVLIKVNGERAEINWADARYLKNIGLYRAKDPYFEHVLSNRGDSDLELTIKSAETGKTATLMMTPKIESEGRYVYFTAGTFQKQKSNINPLGILLVIISTILFIYYFFFK